jgi:hypothetical protein
VEPQIVSLGAPEDLSDYSRVWRGGGDGIPFGKYELSERISASLDDECWIVRTMGLSGFDRRTFLRRFPAERLSKPVIEACKRQAMVTAPGVAQMFELGRIDGQWGFIAGQYVDGVSIDELPQQPWLVALALVHDACGALARIAERGADAALTERRLRLSMSGELVLCMGMPDPVTPPWHRAVCDVLRLLLGLSANADEQVLLDGLFTDDNPDAVWVVSDALVERHPELDPVLPMVFLALAGKADRGEVRRMLVECTPVDELRGLWKAVIDFRRR